MFYIFQGFIIGLLAILIAVGVGLIVHFAENRKFECVFPEGSGAVGSGSRLGGDNGSPGTN